MLTVRPATIADIRSFYPEWTASFRAWVAELDGEVQGIIGLCLLRPVAFAFSQFREPLRPYLKHPAILRLIKRAQAAYAASIVPVTAVPDPNEDAAPRTLTRLGFRYIGKIDGEKVYQFYGGPY